MHRPPRIAVKMALRAMRRQEVQDTRACISNRVVAGKWFLSSGGVCKVSEWVGHCSLVAVDFCKVATLGVFDHVEAVDECLCRYGFIGDFAH